MDDWVGMTALTLHDGHAIRLGNRDHDPQKPGEISLKSKARKFDKAHEAISMCVCVQQVQWFQWFDILTQVGR